MALISPSPCPWLCARCSPVPAGFGGSCGCPRLVPLCLSSCLCRFGLLALAARRFSLLAPALVGPRPARGLSAWLCPVDPSLAVCLGAPSKVLAVLFSRPLLPFRPSRAVSPRQVAVLSLPPVSGMTFAGTRPWLVRMWIVCGCGLLRLSRSSAVSAS